jgi:outer membrane protein OmpA-like peptidoglycan-associated protein
MMSFKSLLIMLIGLASLAGLSLFCINHHTPLIEADLEKRTTASLQFEGMEWSQASADGQVITLNGFAPNQALRHEAGEHALAVWGVDAVINRIKVTKAPVVTHAAVQPPVNTPQATLNNEASKPSEPPPSPYELKLAYDGKTAILTGHIPDDKARSDIRESTRQHLEKGSVITRLKIASGAPEGFIQSITQGLIPHLKEFTQVTAILMDRDLSITGTTSSSETRDALRQSISSALPEQIAATFNIEIPQEEISAESPMEQKTISAELCQKQFDELLTGQQVTFVLGRVIIDESSYALLDSLISTANECPETNIEIAGHTDSSGSSNYNLTISQQRAGAVLSYFVSKDIDIERLTSKGYGEARPIARNSTAEGQAINRRIEFIIKEQ